MYTFDLAMQGYRLTTAEIFYQMPDHPDLLQAFIWQELDQAPRFPVLNRFLHFWQTSLDGKIQSVRVASRGLFQAAELKLTGKEFTLH